MQCFDRYKGLPAGAQDAVIAIGNFDGVHHGHRYLLDAVREKARAMGKKAGVLTFEPHPRHLFRPDDPPFRLTPAPVKMLLLQEGGLDLVYAVPFDWDFASQSAEQFINNVLKNGIRPAHIIVGEDFCFGQLRKGTPQTLREAGFDVTILPKIDDGRSAVSATRIRQHLRVGEIAQANALLGWEWTIEGIVQKGDQRGRTLGFPTANVPLGETLHPAYGVYAAWVRVGDADAWYPSATNIGIRPMFELKIGQVEAHILDFSRDIYGQRLQIRPVRRLRGEARFDSLEALVAQIRADCAHVREILQKP